MSGTGNNVGLPGRFEPTDYIGPIGLWGIFSSSSTIPGGLKTSERAKACVFCKCGYTRNGKQMISLDLSTHIYRPLTQVFRFVATPENDFQWQYGTLESSQISKGEMGLGALFRATGHFLGQRIESTYEVTEFEPDKSYGFQSRSGPLDSHTLYTFELSKATTKISLSARVSFGDLFKPGDCTVEKKIMKQYRENFALLKGVLEADRINKI